MCHQPFDSVDFGCLGYELLAIIPTGADPTRIERQAQEDGLSTVYSIHRSGHTYVWGKPEFGMDTPTG